MAKVPFTVSARTALLIGQENFTNADGAVIELVKNSYDADSTIVLVIFDDSEEDPANHKIHIIDNGDGMTEEVLITKWMQIGTDNKKIDHTTLKGRIKTGAKGIGRFALDRLGSTTTMISKSIQSNDIVKWEMNWKQFEEPNKTISEIKATVEVDKSSELLPQIIHQLPGSANQKLLQSGNRKESLPIDLKKEDFKNGTMITISSLKDEWNQNQLNKLYKDLEALIPPADLELFSVYMQSSKLPGELGKVSTAYFNDFDYKIEAEYDSKNLQVKLKFIRDEFDINQLKNDHSDIFRKMEAPYDLQTLVGKSFEDVRDIRKILKWNTGKSAELLTKVGDFKFVFYFLKRGPERDGKFPHKNASYGERRKTLDRFGGIKIYRDSFRVRPYGEPGDDWLDLGKRQAASPAGPGQIIGGWRISPTQIAGSINISRIDNPDLIDKSDRSSLIENDAFDTFKKIVVGIIGELEYDRSKIFNPIYLEWERKRAEEEEERINVRAEEIAKKIVEERDRSDDEIKEKESIIKQEVGSALKEFATGKDEETEKEEATLRGLASLGIIVSASSHELRGLRNNILPDIKDLRSAIRKNISDKELDKLEPEEHPLKIIDGIEDDQKKVKYWLNYAITGINRDKRTRKNLDLNHYFEKFKQDWDELLSIKNITLELHLATDESCILRAFEIDMDTLFNNLVSNSIDAFMDQTKVVERKISIGWKKRKDYIHIIYQDNGPGLSDVFRYPEEIFIPFVSSKKDDEGNELGTGLGMYLVNLTVQNYNGEIIILSPKEGFAVEVRIPTRKTKNE